MLELIVYSPSARVIEKSKNEYEYEGHRNWVKKRYYEWHYWDATDKYTLMSEEVRTLTYADKK